MRDFEYRTRRGASKNKAGRKAGASKSRRLRAAMLGWIAPSRSGENRHGGSSRGSMSVDRRIAPAPSHSILCAIAVLAITVALAVVVPPDAMAQTLTQPNPQTKSPPPTVTTKSRPAGHVKICDAYGAGFVNIPGTDACIKVGGGVTVDVGR
jgi:hypothetical protein